MGAGESNVADAVKAQAAGSTPIYDYIDLKGGGKLIDFMKRAPVDPVTKEKNFQEVKERIREDFRQFLLNDGKGERLHISRLVEHRSGRPAPAEVADLKEDISTMEPVTEESRASEERGKTVDPKYKDVCWKLDIRGSVGETPLHVCLLKSTAIHAELAKLLLEVYPNLIKDIYVSSEYYGENVLHMAIVNEDPKMVRFLLEKGADCEQRCCGNFFTPDDQKASRKDNFDHEYYELPKKTNYEGYTYWGEFPLGFAVCLGQEECVRLLLATNPKIIDFQDSNGNCALHLIVIHYPKMRSRMETGKNYCGPEDMFDLLVEMKATLNLENRQKLTPLALAAKLARKEMFEHIMRIDREVYWVYGNVSCAGYPLTHIDTIATKTGNINTNSVTYNVIFGDKPEHLEMIEGTIEHLLHEKWKTFAQSRFYRRFALFILYFGVVMVAFALRPGTPNTNNETSSNETTTIGVEVTEVNPCYLLDTSSTVNIVRIVFELLTLFGSVVYIILALKEIYNQGGRIFGHTLREAPSKTLFLISNCIVILMIPVRASCASKVEDVMAVLALLSTGPYFLYFSRGFKIVGPFVVMIYIMIKTDLLRFFIIYLIFVVGFSQAMFVLFRGYDNVVFNTAIEAMLGMFRMSLGAFADVYETFATNNISAAYLYAPKIIFVIYMILVTLLLVNMLIAMMGHTYENVNESQKEWQRQWAKIILLVEQTVTKQARIEQQKIYSQPMRKGPTDKEDGMRALALRRHLTDKEKLMMMQKSAEVPKLSSNGLVNGAANANSHAFR